MLLVSFLAVVAIPFILDDLHRNGHPWRLHSQHENLPLGHFAVYPRGRASHLPVPLDESKGNGQRGSTSPRAGSNVGPQRSPCPGASG